MTHRTSGRRFLCFGLVVVVVGALCESSSAQDPFLLINEIYFDPGGGGIDSRDEYVELRGTPNMSLENYYLITIENENDLLGLGNTGQIEHIFDLNYTGQLMGSSGFMTLRQKGSLYPVNAGDGGLHLINTGAGTGWGNNFGAPGNSSLGSSDDPAPECCQLENGGFTAWLIRNDSDGGGNAPEISFDLDAGNDGLDFLDYSGANWVIDNPNTGMRWTILDSIAFTEPGEAFNARYYAKINYGFESPVLDPFDPDYFNPDEHIELDAGAVYVPLGFEVEYLGRWGNSTGSTDADWHISNFTDRVQAGSGGVFDPDGPDWRQSGDPHPPSDGNPNTPPPQPATIESNKGVPYGTQLGNDLGRPNFITGDYNKDGYVNAADYTVYRNSLGQAGSDAADLPADGDHDYLVGPADYQIWKDRYGEPISSGAAIADIAAAKGSQVPEPASAAIAALALVGQLILGRRRDAP